ncbi:hypothetical protein [Bradyrhizobium lablabi]|uniref:hypothetical protein n=1 Tax=Bradyrhizobium lablabi TaxID=722472 RepID=UPI00070BABF6|nr:hypothetical protein [Bradyrhizobium lablabi]
MTRFESNLYRTPVFSGLIVVALLVFGAIVVRSVGPAERGDTVITASDHGRDRTRTTAENGGRVPPDIGGIKGLRGSLP